MNFVTGFVITGGINFNFNCDQRTERKGKKENKKNNKMKIFHFNSTK